MAGQFRHSLDSDLGSAFRLVCFGAFRLSKASLVGNDGVSVLPLHLASYPATQANRTRAE